MTTQALNRINDLCQKLASFAEANDREEAGVIKKEECFDDFDRDGNAIKHAYRWTWVTDAHSRKWEIFLSKSYKASSPLQIEELRISNVSGFGVVAHFGPIPQITLTMNDLPSHRDFQDRIQQKYSYFKEVGVHAKYWHKGWGEKGKWKEEKVLLGNDEWVSDAGRFGSFIIVEFKLDSIEKLVHELICGRVSKDEMAIARKKYEEERKRKIAEARAHVKIMTMQDRKAFGHTLQRVGSVAYEQEYRAESSADSADCIRSMHKEAEEEFLLQAYAQGGEIIIVSPIEENGGIYAGVVSQKGEVYRYADGRKKSMSKRAEKAEPISLPYYKREIEIIDLPEYLNRADTLKFVGELDATGWDLFIGTKLLVDGMSKDALEKLTNDFFVRKAQALDGDVILVKHVSKGALKTRAQVYRTL